MAPQRPMVRKKIEIRRITSEAGRHVSFSKRRSGLFSKVSQLSTLCGVEIAAVAFSPAGKAFTIGHPSVGSVLDRYRNSNSSEAHAAASVDGGTGDPNQALEELHRELGELRAQLAAIKGRKEAAAKARAEGCQVAAGLELETDLSQLGEEDLWAFAAALTKVDTDSTARINQLLQEARLFGRPVHGSGGGGEFEIGGTSANGGLEMTQKQQQQQMTMMLEMPPTGFAVGTEVTQQQQQQHQQQQEEMMQPQQQQQHKMMEMPPTGFAAGIEMMMKQQQQQQMTEMPPPTEFTAGIEMMMQQQQQQQAMMTEVTQQQQQMEMLPPTGFTAGIEIMMMQQQQTMMMAVPPPTRFAAGSEMMMQQQQMMMMGMAPLPPEFGAGTETAQQQMMMTPPQPGLAPEWMWVHQGFGHGFSPSEE